MIAETLAGNWQHFDSFAWHDKPKHPEQWAIVYTHNRDSGLLDQSNAGVIATALAPFTDDVRAEHHGHWACGWVDGFAIRVYRGGQLTKAFKVYQGLQERLADYCVLDESDYSERETTAALENIASEGRYAGQDYNLPEDWVTETYRWLCDNNDTAVENCDDQGAYPSEDELREAFDALGYNKA